MSRKRIFRLSNRRSTMNFNNTDQPLTDDVTFGGLENTENLIFPQRARTSDSFSLNSTNLDPSLTDPNWHKRLRKSSTAYVANLNFNDENNATKVSDNDCQIDETTNVTKHTLYKPSKAKRMRFDDSSTNSYSENEFEKILSQHGTQDKQKNSLNINNTMTNNSATVMWSENSESEDIEEKLQQNLILNKKYGQQFLQPVEQYSTDDNTEELLQTLSNNPRPDDISLHGSDQSTKSTRSTRSSTLIIHKSPALKEQELPKSTSEDVTAKTAKQVAKKPSESRDLGSLSYHESDQNEDDDKRNETGQQQRVSENLESSKFLEDHSSKTKSVDKILTINLTRMEEEDDPEINATITKNRLSMTLKSRPRIINSTPQKSPRKLVLDSRQISSTSKKVSKSFDKDSSKLNKSKSNNEQRSHCKLDSLAKSVQESSENDQQMSESQLNVSKASNTSIRSKVDMPYNHLIPISSSDEEEDDDNKNKSQKKRQSTSTSYSTRNKTKTDSNLNASKTRELQSKILNSPSSRLNMSSVSNSSRMRYLSATSINEISSDEDGVDYSRVSRTSQKFEKTTNISTNQSPVKRKVSSILKENKNQQRKKKTLSTSALTSYLANLSKSEKKSVFDTIFDSTSEEENVANQSNASHITQTKSSKKKDQSKALPTDSSNEDDINDTANIDTSQNFGKSKHSSENRSVIKKIMRDSNEEDVANKSRVSEASQTKSSRKQDRTIVGSNEISNEDDDNDTRPSHTLQNADKNKSRVSRTSRINSSKKQDQTVSESREISDEDNDDNSRVSHFSQNVDKSKRTLKSQSASKKVLSDSSSEKEEEKESNMDKSEKSLQNVNKISTGNISSRYLRTKDKQTPLKESDLKDSDVNLSGVNQTFNITTRSLRSRSKQSIRKESELEHSNAKLSEVKENSTINKSSRSLRSKSKQITRKESESEHSNANLSGVKENQTFRTGSRSLTSKGKKNTEKKSDSELSDDDVPEVNENHTWNADSINESNVSSRETKSRKTNETSDVAEEKEKDQREKVAAQPFNKSRLSNLRNNNQKETLTEDELLNILEKSDSDTNENVEKRKFIKKDKSSTEKLSSRRTDAKDSSHKLKESLNCSSEKKDKSKSKVPGKQIASEHSQSSESEKENEYSTNFWHSENRKTYNRNKTAYQSDDNSSATNHFEKDFNSENTEVIDLQLSKENSRTTDEALSVQADNNIIHEERIEDIAGIMLGTALNRTRTTGPRFEESAAQEPLPATQTGAKKKTKEQSSKFLIKPIQGTLDDFLIPKPPSKDLPPSELGLKYGSLQQFDKEHNLTDIAERAKASKKLKDLRQKLVFDPYIIQETRRIEREELMKKEKEREEKLKKKEQKKQLKKKQEEALRKQREKEEKKRKQTERDAKVPDAFKVNGKVYKPPALYAPRKWCTPRLYAYLQSKLEPNYGLKTRIKSEQIMKTLVEVVDIVTKAKKYEDYKEVLAKLKNMLARKGIVVTHDDFYFFCTDYLNHDFRIKVIPMMFPGNIMNIPDHDPTQDDKPILG